MDDAVVAGDGRGHPRVELAVGVGHNGHPKTPVPFESDV